MASSTSSEPQSKTGSAGDVDKVGLYGTWSRWLESKLAWQQRLHRSAAHKALDIPEQDMGDIHANRTGIGAIGAMGIAAVAGLAPTALAAVMAWKLLGNDAPGPAPAPAAPVPAPAPAVPDSEYEVRFYDADGKPIEVPHISTRPKP